MEKILSLYSELDLTIVLLHPAAQRSLPLISPFAPIPILELMSPGSAGSEKKKSDWSEYGLNMMAKVLPLIVQVSPPQNAFYWLSQMDNVK